jgi:photosystem II stability/assembly factor-like uncharacterized protein
MATTSDQVWLGTRKGAMHMTKSNGSWRISEPALPGQPVPYVVRDHRDGKVWASLDHGHWGVKLSRSDDDGKTFTEIEPPKYPESTGKSAKYYWVLTPGHDDEPETFYVGTEPGALFTTRDGGGSWEMNQPLWDLCVAHKWTGGGRDGAGIHSILVDPRDAKHIYVAISCAGVLESKDGGDSWAYVTKGMTKVFAPPEEEEVDYGHDPHFVAMTPSNPDVLWQANHCGVFRTTNGAASWDELSQKPHVYFGFPVAAHPTQPDTAWIVPMHSDNNRTTFDGALFVMRTDDGGQTWREQRTGLPQVNAWDFPYRHSLDIGADGETLVFGTTSGNVYMSEDGGDSWATVSNNLPVIYSARFA